MKNLLLACLCFPLLLAACNGPLDVTLADSGDPVKSEALKKALSPEEAELLVSYVAQHTMAQDIDYRMTVKQAIAARRKELAANQQ
ncbi:hypothetical protein HF313_30450 [Massilia atriviolacea]|uniref:Uncharacterized protein n=1 Tax=Massilia atriviolacea TaxID=2495579 RepID=A0A430HCX4_9BURK|nr:hypothetical protein [Massilia atriviolacea]RSZ55362.1 hypothetical protein EJB06_29725 [Massilia atriviolacea]